MFRLKSQGKKSDSKTKTKTKEKKKDVSDSQKADASECNPEVSDNHVSFDVEPQKRRRSSLFKVLN